MNSHFVFDTTLPRVVFGAGTFSKLPDEADRLGLRRMLVLSTPGHRGLAQQAADVLGGRAVGIHAEAVMHVPRDIADAARAEAASRQADGIVTIGGGSTIGLGKAIALESGLPIIAVPTTYSGSEMTPIWGLTEGGVKKTGRDRRVLPRTVIYDPMLTLTLPARLSATSGMNAIAHCVEALYAPDANPIVSMMAEDGIRALAGSLPVICRDPQNLEARSDAFYGAWLAGTSLGAVAMGLHHKLCHTLGGTFNLPHAETHTVVLPHATRYNAAAAPDAMRRIAGVLNADDAAYGLFDLAVTLNAPTALREIGMNESDLDVAADLATRNPYANPAPVTRDGVRALLQNAFDGARP